METNKIFSYSYNKKHGLRFGFLLQTIFCSKIDEFDRKLIYILHVSGILPDDILKYHRHKIDKEFLIKFMFQKTDGKKIIPASTIRELVQIEDKGTFLSYFDSLGYKGRRSFTLSEAYEIISYWYGKDYMVVFDSLKKGDIALRFTDGKYERLEEEITDNKIMDLIKYRNHDYIMPKYLREYIESVKMYNLIDVLDKDEQILKYFDLIAFLFLISMFH
ncbi:hypothetical protein [Winogradskyella ursingii]|uniref:hypothetical protein n=1 Tax=Winogradskyella ursingii TaxID=2686079 RepID=UPI0015C97705|nr:hypothetical protein [Winogradskyella ursingii]